MTVVTSALLCHVVVSPSQLASDPLLELILLKLVSPLQVKVEQKPKATLSMTLSDHVFTQRNVIIKTLVGVIGVKQNQTGRPLLSHPKTPFGSAGLTAWMSVADSIRRRNAANDLLTSLNSHLEHHAFLLLTSHAPSIADLDLSIELLTSDQLLNECQSHVHILRWLQTCHALLLQSGCNGLPSSVTHGKSAAAFNPVFFDGTEDDSLVFQSKSQSPQAKQQTNAKQADISKGQQGDTKKKDKKEKKAAQQPKEAKQQEPAAAEALTAEYNVSALDVRVGEIIKAWHHPEAEKLFCEEIDLGNGEVRQIASGLRPFYETNDLIGRSVLVLCNLKKRNLVGFASHGMVLCASNADHTAVKFVVPPNNASPGDRVVFGDFTGEPEPEAKIAKKKIFEKIAPDLKTDANGKVVWKDAAATVGGEAVTAELNDAHVS